MSDESKNAVQFQPSGNGKPDPDGSVEDGSQDAPVTRKEWETLKTDFTSEIRQSLNEDIRRTVQSFSDKQENRIRKKIEDTIDKLTDQGFEITDEIKQDVTKRVTDQEINRIIAATGDANQDGTQKPDGGGSQDALNPTTAAALEIMRAADVFIMPDDDEFNMIRQDSPAAFLTSVQAAVTAKAQRLAGSSYGQHTPPEDLSRPARRTPTNAGAVGGGANLRAQYQQEVNNPLLSKEERLTIRAKYRKLGLKN